MLDKPIVKRRHEFLGLLDQEKVAAAIKHYDPRICDAVGHPLRARWRTNRIACAAHNKGWTSDSIEFCEGVVFKASKILPDVASLHSRLAADQLFDPFDLLAFPIEKLVAHEILHRMMGVIGPISPPLQDLPHIRQHADSERVELGERCT